jgi:hypothetical protein
VIFETEDVRTLVDAGFIAWSRGLYAEAGRIFEAVRLIRPASEVGFIGGALVSLRKGDALDAVEQLRKQAPTDSVRAFLGFALLKLGEREEALAILHDVVRFAGDRPPGKLARSILEETDDSPNLAI